MAELLQQQQSIHRQKSTASMKENIYIFRWSPLSFPSLTFNSNVNLFRNSDAVLTKEEREREYCGQTISHLVLCAWEEEKKKSKQEGGTKDRRPLLELVGRRRRRRRRKGDLQDCNLVVIYCTKFPCTRSLTRDRRREEKREIFSSFFLYSFLSPICAHRSIRL